MKTALAMALLAWLAIGLAVAVVETQNPLWVIGSILALWALISVFSKAYFDEKPKRGASKNDR